MDLILIYGPPASGKHTITQELIKKMDYKFLHNHAVIDLAMLSLDKSKPSFWTFCWKLRFEVVKEAVNENINGLIMSMAFTGTENEIKSMNKIVRYVEKAGGKVKLIKLTCDFDELKNRVSSESRKKFGKVKTINRLKGWYKHYQEIDIVPNRDILILDTKKLSPKKSAEKIIEFLHKEEIGSE